MRKYENNNYQTNLITVPNQCYIATLCKSFKSLYRYMFMFHQNTMSLIF